MARSAGAGAAAVKTTPTKIDPARFLAEVADETRQADALVAMELMQRVTGQPPVMWGSSIVGFGEVSYQLASGRTGSTAAVGFSPRKESLTLYLTDGVDLYAELLGRLGPHRTGKSCVYLKRLDEVDLDVLSELVATSYRYATKTPAE